MILITKLFITPMYTSDTQLYVVNNQSGNGNLTYSDLQASSQVTQDYVIIDTPPLGSVVDSMIVAKECDSVILVVSANATSRKFAAKIKNQLERNDIKLLGVVLNKVPRGKKKYGYGSYGHKNVEKLEEKSNK